MLKLIRSILPFVGIFGVSQAQAGAVHPLFELGMYRAATGETQDIAIAGLIGNRYIVRDHYDTNVLVGAGLLFNGLENTNFIVQYGINAFYMDNTRVSGPIQQEMLFENLNYNYHVAHRPVYAMVKAFMKTKSSKMDVTFDVGIGPNFMNINGFSEHSLDGGITIPDNAFVGRSTTQLSEMIGIGFQVNEFFGKVPFELGYRFFNLGKGSLVPQIDGFLNNLSTGNITGQALVATVRF